MVEQKNQTTRQIPAMKLTMDKKTSKSSKKIRMLSPRHQTIEAYRRLGLSLPPIESSTHAHNSTDKRKEYHSMKSGSLRTKPHPVVSLTIGKKLSDFVRKPVYFCHPIVLPIQEYEQTKKTSTTTVEKMKLREETNLKVKFGEEFLGISKVATKANKPEAYEKSKKQSEKKDKKDISRQFLEFCKTEGYDSRSAIFFKASTSFKKAKKFSKISKEPPLTPINESKVCIAGIKDSTKREVGKIVNEKLKLANNIPNLKSAEKSKPSDTRTSIKETAQASAVKGQSAASKAITFILSDSGSKKKRITLPPLEKSSLHTFITTWKPDVSVADNQVIET